MNNSSELNNSFTAELLALFSSFDITQLHFLRPLWLLGCIVAVVLVVLLWRQKKQAGAWHKFIDDSLLKHLLDGQIARTQKRLFIALLCAWIITCIAMAGPSWHKLPQPVHKNEAARVILFDLSPSMTANDLKPSRLVRARLKLIDLLQSNNEGLHALIAYGGEAHVVTPLTDDIDTIINQLPALSPAIMPMAGSNVEMATEKALQLFSESGLSRGDILLVTDGVEEIATDTVRDLLRNTQFRLSILGVGSDEGAPIASGRGGFARDARGAIVIAKLNSAELRSLATDLDGHFSLLRSDDSDIEFLGSLEVLTDQRNRKISREFDIWQDAGQWLCLLLLPFALLAFRRGLILPALLFIPFMPQPASAFGWADLWQTADQQGQRLLEQGDASNAATRFNNNNWQASAQYKAGDYKNAAENFAASDSAKAHYNRGNALARSGELEEALNAYDQALAANSDFEDAQFNRELVENLKQQKDQQKDQQEQQDSDQDQSEEQDKEQGDKQDQDNNGESDDNSKSESNDDSETDSEGDPKKNTEDSSEEEQNSEPNDPQTDDKSGKDDEQEQKQPDYSEPEQASDQEESDEQKSEPKPDESPQPSEQEEQQGLTEAQIQAQAAEEQAQQEQLEQWLRGIPDDPGGLLRNKFKHQHQQQLRSSMRGRDNKPENGAAEHW